ncbi:MAG: hypothetical protein V4734_06695 [Terriglobus sp.]
MRRFLLVLMAGVLGLFAVSMQAQQSIGDAMRRAHAVSASLADTQGLAAPPVSLEDTLHSLYQRAEVVFTGEVLSVERTGDAVVVTFHVEDGIRTLASGSTYVLREWAGLWTDDPLRYVVGERRLMLLHANSVCGFASPAGGQVGAIRLRGDALQQVADVRWLAAQVATAPMPTVSAFAKTLPISLGSDEKASAMDHGAVDAAVLTGMMHAWQRAEVVQ